IHRLRSLQRRPNRHDAQSLHPPGRVQHQRQRRRPGHDRRHGHDPRRERDPRGSGVHPARKAGDAGRGGQCGDHARADGVYDGAEFVVGGGVKIVDINK
ncbi:hypothetical protein T310_9020, partial [Rasamsonia emersonii CBS 393.64]